MKNTLAMLLTVLAPAGAALAQADKPADAP